MNLVSKIRGRRPKPDENSSLVDVMAYATIAFLYERETSRSIARVMARLGQGLQVDNVMLAPLDASLPGQSWSASGQEPCLETARAALPLAEEWMRQLAQGSVVAANLGKGAAHHSVYLERWEAASAIIAPVFVNGHWWGFLAAFSKSAPHPWSRMHGKLMLAIAGTLSAALQSAVESTRLEESRASLLTAQRRADTYRKRLDELVLASHDAILIIEPDGLVSRWNKPANELFGFGSTNRPGRSFDDFLPFAVRDTVSRMVAEARLGHATHAQAFDVTEGLGCRNLLVSIFPLGDPPGTVAVVAQDQTETVSFRQQLEKSLEATIEALASAMEARDPYTAGHQRRTAALARRIAQVMGLPDEEVRGVYTAAVIHDIGKICVPAEILTCPRRLNPAEFALIKMHSQAGHDIVKTVKFPWPVGVMILQHHEKMDGSGYPNQISGGQIHMGARIIGVADTVEAITNHRPYRPALGLDVARQELLKGKFRIFDPAVVDACVAVLAAEGNPLE